MEGTTGCYVVRRLLQMIPVFIGATLLIFLMVHVLPGDPIRAMCGVQGGRPRTRRARCSRSSGSTAPVAAVPRLHGQLFTGDFGTAFNGQPVTELMATAFPITLRLTIVAILFEIVIGITLGVCTVCAAAARRHHRAGPHPGRHLRPDLRHRLLLQPSSASSGWLSSNVAPRTPPSAS